jgi:histidinol-phosphatase
MKQSTFLKTALKAAKEAENIILHYFNENVHVSIKKDQSPVTIADKEAERTIKKIISKQFPDHGFLGEEEGVDKPDAEYVWIIDPIDGTKNYIRRIPIFGTQIALMHNNQLVLGVSNLPAFHEMIYAEKGSGAYFNAKKINVSKVETLKNAYVSYGSLHWFEKNHKEKQLRSLINKCYHTRSFGDCWAYYLLAHGKIDVVLEGYVRIWDVAASVVIIQEAGGQVTDLEGRPVTVQTESFIATNGFLHKKVLENMK